MINHLEASEVFVPLTVIGEGVVVIQNVYGEKFGGDLCDLWASNVYIKNLHGQEDMPTRPYNVYHPDAVQVERLVDYKPSHYACQQHIEINNIDVVMKNPDAGGITMSGLHQYYAMKFGFEKLKMHLKNEHIVNGYSANELEVGGPDVDVTGDVYINS